MISFSFTLPILMFLSLACAAQQPAGAPAPAPSPATTPAPAASSEEPAPATDARLTRDAELDRILDALDRRGRDLRSLAADVTLTETDAALGENVTRTGSFALEIQPDGSARSRVTFNDKVANNRKTQEKIEYLLDGPNLIDRTYRTRTQVTRQVLRPGEKLNLLKLGEGPFPLPIGQDTEEVHRLFEASKVQPEPEDPPDTVHIRLIPRPDSQFADRFNSIDAWVDLADHMPKRIETVDANQVTVRTTELSNVRVNEELGDRRFALEPVGSDWTLLNEAYER